MPAGNLNDIRLLSIKFKALKLAKSTGKISFLRQLFLIESVFKFAKSVGKVSSRKLFQIRYSVF